MTTDNHAYAPADHIQSVHVDFYRENGFLIAVDLFTADEVQEIKDETLKIFRGERGMIEGMQDVTADETDVATLLRYLCIHFPHKLSDVIHKYLVHPGTADVLQKLISPNVKAMQSMLFVKLLIHSLKYQTN